MRGGGADESAATSHYVQCAMFCQPALHICTLLNLPSTILFGQASRLSGGGAFGQRGVECVQRPAGRRGVVSISVERAGE
jgi:hypothetical protein